MNQNNQNEFSTSGNDIRDDYYYDETTGSYKKRTPQGAGDRQENPSEKRKGNAALFSLVLAIASFLFLSLPLGFPMVVCAILLGIYALIRRQSKRTALAGIFLSFLSAAGWLIFSLHIAGSGSLSGHLSSATDSAAAENHAVVEETPRQDAPADAGSDAPDPEELERQETEKRNAAVTIREYPLSDSLLLICENGNLTDVNLYFQVIFYDAGGQMLSIEERWRDSCPAGGRSAVTLRAPMDQENTPVPYDHYELTMESEEADPNYDCINYGSSLDIVSNVGVDGNVLVSVTNSTERTFTSIELACIYYQGAEAVGMATQYLSGLSDHAAMEFFTPYNYTADIPEPITFDRHEILVLGTDYSME